MRSPMEKRTARLAEFMARAIQSGPWWLLCVPLFLLGPIALRGELFLPQLPVGQEPLRSEYPDAARAADEALHFTSSDRLFPALTDQLAMGEALRAGSLPTWEPNQGLGIPLFAQSIAGPSYPVNWISFLFSPAKLAGPLAGLSLLLAGLGAWLFLRRLGLTARAALLGAVAYQFGGWGIANLYLFMKVDAALYLPWCLWAIEGLAQGRRHAGLTLCLAMGLSLLAGFLPIGVFVCLASGLYALWRLAPWPWDRKEQPSSSTARGFRRLAVALAFAALGVGTSALAMGPLLEASAQSERQAQSASELSGQALPSSTLLGLGFKDLFGLPTDSTPSGNLPVAWWLTPEDEALAAEHANVLEWNTYIGAAVLLLALVGLCAAPRRAALPAGLLVLVYGFAMAWPPFCWLYALPGLDAGAPARVLALAWFLWPWLAALGLDAIERKRPRALGSLAALAALMLLGALVLWLRAEPRAWTDAFEAGMVARYDEIASVGDVRARLSEAGSLDAAARLRASAALCGGMALLALWSVALTRLRPGRNALAICSWMLLAGVAAEGALSAQGHLKGQSDQFELFPASPSIEAVRRAAGDGRVLRYSPGGPADVVALARPNMLQPYGIADLTPWVVFPPKTHNDLFAAFDPAARFQQGFARLSDPALLDNPILDLFDVTAILSRTALEHPRLELVMQREGFNVYHRTGAFGRARLVSYADIASDDSLVPEILASGALDLEHETLLAARYQPRGHELSRPPASPGELISLTRPEKNQIDVTIEGAEGGLLVLHEQYYPGWHATRNGEPVEILRSDHAFQAIALLPGTNFIHFNYYPDSLRLGLWISGAALLTALLLSFKLST